jgi:hypothetical protein
MKPGSCNPLGWQPFGCTAKDSEGRSGRDGWPRDSDRWQSAQLPPHIGPTLKSRVRPGRRLAPGPLPERREGRHGFHDSLQESVSAPLISTANAVMSRLTKVNRDRDHTWEVLGRLAPEDLRAVAAALIPLVREEYPKHPLAEIAAIWGDASPAEVEALGHLDLALEAAAPRTR